MASFFLPNHNARKDYYLVRGDLAGSWDGLAPSVVIVNWNLGERDKSLKFFADRGHKQVLCGFYDAPSEAMAGWLKDASGVPGIVGVMYTTWANNFSELEKYSKVVDSARGAPGAK